MFELHSARDSTLFIHTPRAKEVTPSFKRMESIDNLETYLHDLTLEGVSATGRDLGVGAYGKVFTVDYRGKAYAAKEVQVQPGNENEKKILYEDFLRECYYCSKLCHPNIVDFIGIYHHSKNSLPVMVMELMDESLTKYVKKQNLDKETKFSILYDISCGLNYLHSYKPQPLIHCDLSPNNILLMLCKHKPWPVAKVGDLGVAKVVKGDSQATKSAIAKSPGIIDFMPPEALSENPHYDTPLDIFSYAGIILYVVNKEWPTPEDPVVRDPNTNEPLHVRTEVQRRKDHVYKMSGAEKVLSQLVIASLNDNPSKRPTAATVLKIMEFLIVSLVWLA